MIGIIGDTIWVNLATNTRMVTYVASAHRDDGASAAQEWCSNAASSALFCTGPCWRRGLRLVGWAGGRTRSGQDWPRRLSKRAGDMSNGRRLGQGGRPPLG